MSYQKLVWQNDITPVDATNMNHIEDGIEKAYNVTLIAVSDTAPSTCSTGDKYFNTTTNKVYTATATNTWGETGENPQVDMMYVVFDAQATYSWNGSEMISVGGGKAEVSISTTEPTDEEKIWIDPSNVPSGIGSYISNSYGTSQAIGYSQEYVNKNLIYSTNEVKTNKVWIDNKPIYRKTVNLVADTTAQSILITSIASDIAQIWIDSSSSFYGEGGIISDWEVSGGRYRITIDSGNVYYICSTYAYRDGMITFNYTKTTD